MWDGLLWGYSESAGGTQVGGIINARGCIEPAPAGDTAGLCPAPPASPDTPPFTRSIRVSVAWQGNEDTAAPTTSVCGSGLYGAETKRRVVSLDLMVMQTCP